MIPCPRLALISAASSILLLAGCARTVESAHFTQFGEGAAAVAAQSQAALADSNKLAREVSVDRFIRSGQIGLTESSFAVAVDPKDIVAWQSALSGIQKYATLMASLTDARRQPDTGDAVVALGQQLNGLGAGISPGVAAGFATLAGVLVQQQANSEAVRIIRAADPAMQAIFNGMADAIGGDDQTGLRGTVASNWTASVQGVRLAYVDAAQARDGAKQRSLINQYLGALDSRDVQLRALSNLRSSLLTLAQAHAAEAAEQHASASRLLSVIAAQAEETERLFAAVEAAQAKEGKN